MALEDLNAILPLPAPPHPQPILAQGFGVTYLLAGVPFIYSDSD